MEPLLICFDVDGTLIDDTVFIWQTIHDKLDTDPEEREFWTQAYWDKKISYHEWATKDVEMWMRKNVTRSQLLLAIEELKPMKGVFGMLAELKAAGHKMGVISGSLDIALDRAIPGYEDFFEEVFLNRLTFDQDSRLTGVTPTPFDIEHKATGLRRMAEHLGIPMEKTVFVGDNFNDVEVAKIAGCSIAFNCKSDALAEVSDHLVPGNDLSKILPIIKEYHLSLCFAER